MPTLTAHSHEFKNKLFDPLGQSSYLVLLMLDLGGGMSKPKPQFLRGSHIDAQELFAGWVVLSDGWVMVEGKSSCHFRTNNLPPCRPDPVSSEAGS